MLKCPKCQNKLITKLKNVSIPALGDKNIYYQICFICGWKNEDILIQMLKEGQLTEKDLIKDLSDEELNDIRD